MRPGFPDPYFLSFNDLAPQKPPTRGGCTPTRAPAPDAAGARAPPRPRAPRRTLFDVLAPAPTHRPPTRGAPAPRPWRTGPRPRTAGRHGPAAVTGAGARATRAVTRGLRAAGAAGGVRGGGAARLGSCTSRFVRARFVRAARSVVLSLRFPLRVRPSSPSLPQPRDPAPVMSITRRCYRCRTPVSLYAEVCPRCGAKSPGERKKHRRGALSLALRSAFLGLRLPHGPRRRGAPAGLPR